MSKIIKLMVILSALIYGSMAAQEFQKIDKKIKVSTKKPLKLSVEIDAGRIFIVRNDVSDEMAIQGRLHKEFDELRVDYEKEMNDAVIYLKHRKWLKSGKEKGSAELSILLPIDVTIEFSSTIKAGDIEMIVGGMRFSSFQFKNFAGEVELDFDKPNQIDMDYLDIDVKIGSSKLLRLGNARFEDARINGGIGELKIDFTGWGAKTAHADVDLDIGSTQIILPKKVGVKLRSTSFGFLTNQNISHHFEKKGRYYFSRNYEQARKSLSLFIHSGIGDLNVFVE